MKRMPQPSTSQAIGLSPVCVRLCDLRLLACEKRLPQPSWSQVYGRSFVCMRLCVVRWLDHAKLLRQPSWSQANSLVPVCTLQCFLRSLRLKKRLSQPSCAQANVCSANIGNGLCTESGLGGLDATFIWMEGRGVRREARSTGTAPGLGFGSSGAKHVWSLDQHEFSLINPSGIRI
jgi:hypothetical protein